MAIIIGDEDWAGTFEATGTAVDEGIMCPAGSVELQMWSLSLATYRVDTPFTCDDGTGSFYVHYDLELVIDGGAWTEVGTWTVGRIGTDVYEMLIGNGTDSTTGPARGPFLSIMEGQVAISDG